MALPSGRVRYVVAGPDDAPAVVLLHGGGLDAAAFSWKRTVSALADGFRVYAPDWPGYGGSSSSTVTASAGRCPAGGSRRPSRASPA